MFRIDEYAYAGANDQASRSFFSLVKGGMRTVGGAIARQQAAEFLRTGARPEAPSGPQPAAAEKKPSPEESKVVEAFRVPLRAVAGALTPTRHAVRVPTATIGVRGTHYTVVHCDNDCYEPRRTLVASLLAQSDAGSPGVGELAANGTYAAVSDGRVIVYTNQPPVEFGKQEYFYIASMDSGPQSLIGPPSFLFDRLAGQERQRGRGAPETTANMQQAGLNAESRPSDPPLQPSPPTFVVTESRTESGTLEVLPTASTSTNGLLGAFSNVSGGSSNSTFGAFAGEGTLTTFGSDSSQVLLAFNVSNPTFGSFSGTASGTVVNETTPNDINAYWGIWFEGSVSDGRSTTPLFPLMRAFHYLTGPTTPPDVIAAKVGILSFNLVGGTTPTNNLGETGSMSMSGPLMVDFTKRNVSLPETTFAFPSNVWSFGADSAQIAINGGGAHITKTTPGSFSCTDDKCGSQSAQLQRTGIFMGPAGTHLGVAHHARTLQPTAPQSMETIKLFSCAPNC